MKIKKAVLGDLEGLIRLEKEAKKEFKGWSMTKPEEFADLIRKKLMYVAKEGEKIIAYINVKIIQEKIILDNIYLKKELRGKGTGRELMDRILTDFKKTNFRNVIIACPAILRRFYERFKLKKKEEGKKK